MATTVSDMISQCLRRLYELSVSSPVHWTREELLVFVNDAVFELNLIAWEIQNTQSTTVGTTENVYDCPDTIVAAMAIRDGNRYLFREAVSDLDKEIKWESADAKRLNIETWVPLGLNKFIISPRPLGDKIVYIEGLVMHTILTDSNTDLPIRPEYDNAIQDYVVERAMFKEGGAELAQAAALYKDFIENAQQLSGRNIARMAPRYSKAVVADDTLRGKVESSGGQQ